MNEKNSNTLNTSRLSSLIKGTAAVRIAGLFLSFFVGIQLARYLGVEEYGIYSTVMAIISIFMIPTELGLPRLLTREVARDVTSEKSEAKSIFRWALIQVIKASVLTTAALGCYYFFSGDQEIRRPLIYAAALIPLTALLNIYGATLRGLHFVVVSQVFDTLFRYAFLAFLLFITFFIWGGISAGEALLLSSLSILLPLFLSHIYINRKLKGSIFNNVHEIDKFKSRMYWNSAIPMALTEGMVVIRSNFQILALGVIASIIDVGVFKIAASTLVILTLPITVINIALAPLIARMHKENKIKELAELLKKASIFLFATTLTLFAPFIFFGAEIFLKVFGLDYIDAAEPFYVLGMGMVVSSFFGANAITLNMIGYEKYVFKSGVYSLILLLLISPPLIYYWQSIGAAWGSSIALVYWSLLLWLFCRKKVGLEASLLSLRN